MPKHLRATAKLYRLQEKGSTSNTKELTQSRFSHANCLTLGTISQQWNYSHRRHCAGEKRMDPR